MPQNRPLGRKSAQSARGMAPGTPIPAPFILPVQWRTNAYDAPGIRSGTAPEPPYASLSNFPGAFRTGDCVRNRMMRRDTRPAHISPTARLGAGATFAGRHVRSQCPASLYRIAPDGAGARAGANPVAFPHHIHAQRRRGPVSSGWGVFPPPAHRGCRRRPRVVAAPPAEHRVAPVRHCPYVIALLRKGVSVHFDASSPVG